MTSDTHSPLTITHNPMTGSYALTICGIVHNELFFLEEFLAYYRRLGADRFIILDDRSTDGTREFLETQPDVMILGSDVRYSQQIEYAPEFRSRIMETRAVRLWRDQIMNQFCTDMWAVAVDADEFLALPEGMSLTGLTKELEREGCEAVWGCMVDMYPENVNDILGIPDTARFRFDADWYFDARPLLKFRDGEETPKTIYPGSTARLLSTYRVLAQGSLAMRLRRRLTGYRYEPHKVIHKTPIVLWRKGDYFLNCHQTSKQPSRTRIIPIMHFKFTSDLGRKIEYAISSGSYSRGSANYRLYCDLIETMRARGGRFISGISHRYRSYGDFLETGIAR